MPRKAKQTAAASEEAAPSAAPELGAAEQPEPMEAQPAEALPAADVAAVTPPAANPNSAPEDSAVVIPTLDSPRSLAPLHVLILIIATLWGLWAIRESQPVGFALIAAYELLRAAWPALLLAAGATGLLFTFVPAQCWQGVRRGEALLLSFAGGSGLMSLFVLAMGSTGRWSSFVAIIPLITGIMKFLATPPATWATLNAPPQSSQPSTGNQTPHNTTESWLSAIITGLIFLVAIFLTLGAFAPPLVYDVTEYHMGGLAEFSRMWTTPNFRFDAVPHNFYLRFPFSVQSLYYYAVWFDWPHDQPAKVLNTLYVFAGAATLSVWAARWHVAPAMRRLVALLWLAHPIVLEVSLDAFIDAPCAFFLLAALMGFSLALGDGAQRETTAPLPVQNIAIAGPALIAFGAALASKYTMMQLYAFPVMLLVGIPILLRATRERKLGVILWCAALAAAIPAGWLGRNFVLYGNPLEPFFQKLFGGTAEEIARETYYLRAHFPQSPLDANYWLTLTTRLERVGWLTVAPVAAVGLAAARVRGLWRYAVLALASYLLWNLVRESQNRFLLTSVGIMILLTGVVLTHVRPAVVRHGIVAALMLWSAAEILHHARRLTAGGAINYALMIDKSTEHPLLTGSRTARSQYYRENLGSIGEATAALRETTLPADTRILLVYEARPYLFPYATVYNTVFDASELLRFAADATTTAGIADNLRRAGVTHVLINREELSRFLQQYTPAETLARLGVRALPQDFARLPSPEDYYPPFANDGSWPRVRPVVIEFLRAMETSATLRFGRSDLAVTVTPLP